MKPKKPRNYKTQVRVKKTRTKLNRRDADKLAPLKHRFNLKSRIDLLDYDYLDKLKPEELEWLARFTEEDTNANFNHSGKKINKKKSQRIDSYNRNNARNRDIFTKVKAMGGLTDYTGLEPHKESISSEDAIIDLIDYKNKKIREFKTDLMKDLKSLQLDDKEIVKILKDVLENFEEFENSEN